MQGQSSFDYNCDGFETLAVSNLGECQCDENIDPDNYDECISIGAAEILISEGIVASKTISWLD